MLQHGADADAAQHAALLRFLLASLEAFVVGERQALVEHGGEFAGVVSGADGGLVRERLRTDQVLAAQPDRVDAGDARGLVHHALEAVARLRAARAAIRRGDDGVGEHALRLRVDQLDVVHAGQAAHHVERADVGADRADIRAHRAEVADAQRQELALFVERQLHVAVGIACVVVGEEGLGAARHPVDRAAGLLRGVEDRDVFGVGAGLEAERAADLFGGDADLVVADLHDLRHCVAHGARALGADAQVEAVVRFVVARGRAARLHRGDVQAVVQERDLGDVLRGREHAVDLFLVLLRFRMRTSPIDRDVARRVRPELRRALFDGGAQIDDGVQLFVIDLDGFRAILGCGERFGDDERDGLADVHHAVMHQRRTERHHELAAVAARHRRMLRQAAVAGLLHVLAGQHRDHALDLQGRTGVDGLDLCAGVRRTDEIGLELVRLRGV